MIRVRRSNERFISENNGIRTLHWYSSGAHYDPDRMGFGSIIGYDEHVVQPGCGFAAHRHREVDIYTFVVQGQLRHVDDVGHERIVAAGRMQAQFTGTGIEHSETNASDSEALRFIQILLRPAVSDLSPRYMSAEADEMSAALPVRLMRLNDGERYTIGAPAHLHVICGALMQSTALAGISPGDSVEISGGVAVVSAVGSSVFLLVR